MMGIIQKLRAYALLWPKGCHMFGSGLPSSVGGSTETIAMEQFMKIQSWVFQSMRKKQKTENPRKRKQIIPKICRTPAPFHNSLRLLWFLAGREWGLKYHVYPHLCLPEERLPPPACPRFRGKAVCIHLCAQILKYFWHHVCITPMQFYWRRLQKSLLSCYKAFSIHANLFGHKFRNIVYPAGGK